MGNKLYARIGVGITAYQEFRESLNCAKIITTNLRKTGIRKKEKKDALDFAIKNNIVRVSLGLEPIVEKPKLYNKS